MGLEAPLALLGLLAGLLPIIIHRIRTRDLDRKPWPSIALLQKAAAAQRRKRSLADLLLLLMRIAFLALVALALAAPYVSAHLPFGDGRVASVVIVLDDSMSMTRRQRGETLLGLATESARNALDALPPESEAAVVLAGKPPRVLSTLQNELRTAAAALDRIDLAPTRGTDLSAAVRLAHEQLAAARHAARRILVLSDFAHPHSIDPELLEGGGVEVELERVGPEGNPDNVFFGGVHAAPDPTLEGQTSIAVEILAPGTARREVTLSAWVHGKEVFRTNVGLAGGKGRSVIHVPTPADTADPTARLQLEVDDALAADNVTGVMLRETEGAKVVLVNGDPRPASAEDELYYVDKILRLLPDELAAFAGQTVDPATFEHVDLSHAGVILLANVAAPDSAQVERMRSFVRRGGGLIIAAGDNVSAPAYRATFGDLLPCGLSAPAATRVEGFEPSLQREVFPAGTTGLTRVTTTRRLSLECESGAALTYTDGTPAVAVAEYGRGRVALIASTLDAAWTDLPYRPGFMAFTAAVLRYAAGLGETPTGHRIAAGEVRRIEAPPGALRVEVITPAGDHHTYEDFSDEAVIQFEHTRQAGPYRVLASGEADVPADVPSAAFVVDLPAMEGDLSGRPLGEGASDRAANAGSSVHRPVAGLFFLLAALLALGEGIMRLKPRVR